MRAIVPPDAGSCSYAGTGYANPHAVSQIANGLSTTTYSYDQNGNLSQKDDRRHYHNISLGLCKPSHRARCGRGHDHLWLRCVRLPRPPDHGHVNHDLSVQVVLGRLVDGKRRDIRDHH